MKMSLVEHAKKELRLVGLFDPDSDYAGALGKDVLALVKVFAKQGHSGFSAHMAIDLFSRVARYECLLPLTGEDDEWNDVDNAIYQNDRVPSVFKNKETNRAYYLSDIVWCDND